MAPQSVTTRTLAERVVELYWPQTRPWSNRTGVLLQNAGVASDGRGRARILKGVQSLRSEAHQLAVAGASSLIRVRQLLRPAYDKLIHEVEWTLIDMPLPKLQRVGGHDTGWLYEIGWDDGPNAPRRGEVRRYQQGQPSTFANDIRFKPGVSPALARLHGVLRPFVQQQWADKVATLNQLEEARLAEFLFGADRTPPTAIRQALVDLQSGDCFYCRRPIRGTAQVDHFIPWARHPDDSLMNLVATDKSCNSAKSDFLAAAGHVERWRARALRYGSQIEQIASEHTWTANQRIVGVARAVYKGLPPDGRLWLHKREFERVDRGRLQAALSA